MCQDFMGKLVDELRRNLQPILAGFAANFSQELDRNCAKTSWENLWTS